LQLYGRRDLDLHLGSGHIVYRRASLIDVQNFIEIEEPFVDGRTDI